MIIEKFEIMPFGTNCYIVGDEESKIGLVIDPAAEPDKIVKRVEELGLKIEFILLTHSHPDHIGGIKGVKDATGAQVAIHEAEAGSLEGRSGGGMGFGFSSGGTAPADWLLKGGEAIDVGDLHFLVQHTPGHSPGGICLVGEGVVFSGDTLFNFGIGRYDFPGSSGQQLMESICTKLMVLPDDTAVYPGHGPHSTIGAERAGNPFLQA
ncbi:MBL fold metallo-hydrolase [Chloroflexota bacterium]